MAAPSTPVLTQCPACTQVTLAPHCDETQAVTPCYWRRCTDPKCLAVFDTLNKRGHRQAPERPLLKDKAGVKVPRVRMNYVNGGWRDDPRDGI